MTTAHHEFDLTIRNREAIYLPGILDHTPILVDTATIAITAGNDVLCEWDELNIHAAIQDFEEATNSFDLGLDWHIDIYTPGSIVQILIWRRGEPSARHSVEVADDIYYGRLETIRAHIGYD